MHTRNIQVSEKDGYKHSGVAYPVKVSFNEGECPGPETTRVVHPDGSELPIQMDVSDRWPDGSIREADVLFPLRLPFGRSGVYTLETGSNISPAADQLNPVTIDDTAILTISQGPVTCNVRRSGYSVVDTAEFNRDVWKGRHPTGARIARPKAYLKPGSSAHGRQARLQGHPPRRPRTRHRHGVVDERRNEDSEHQG